MIFMRLTACCLMLLTAVSASAQAVAQQQAAPPSPTSAAGIATPAPSATPTGQTPAPDAAPTITAIPPEAAAQATPKPGEAAVPLVVLNKDEVLEQLRLQTPEAKIELQQLRVVRTRDFAAPGKLPGTLGTITISAEGTMQELMRPGMSFIFRIYTPEHCGLLDIRNARVTELNDLAGQPIRLKPAEGQPRPAGGATGMGDSNILQWDQQTEALIQFNTGLPPRGDEKIGRFAAEVAVDVGVVTPIRVTDLRQRVGQMLLDHPDGANLTVRLESISDDKVVLVAEGAVKRLGEYQFLGANGEPAQAYGKSVDVQAVQPDGHPRQTNTYSFVRLPQVLTLGINYFPKIETKRLQVRFDETPLP